jgi:hypothetical protein
VSLPYGQMAYDPGYLTDPEEDPDFLDVLDVYGGFPDEKYQGFLRSNYWQQARSAVLTRDGHRCVHCNSKYRLQVHHRRYFRRGTELENLHLLETVCRDCHEKEHGLGNSATN